jgi:hypothetical protein
VTHDLIKTGDADSFPQIQDRNGEVVLAYCRRCGEGEGTLAETCPGEKRADRTKAFVDDIIAVYRKHNMVLSHEDGHGSFLVHDGIADFYIAWLAQARHDGPVPL